MGWDIVIFNSKERIKSIEGIDENKLSDIDFLSIFKGSFKEIIEDNNHYEIKGNDFSIEFFWEDDNVSNIMVQLDGENALYALIELAKEKQWSIYDSSIDEMIDLDNPNKNGYKKYSDYVNYIKSSKS